MIGGEESSSSNPKNYILWLLYCGHRLVINIDKGETLFAHYGFVLGKNGRVRSKFQIVDVGFSGAAQLLQKLPALTV